MRTKHSMQKFMDYIHSTTNAQTVHIIQEKPIKVETKSRIRKTAVPMGKKEAHSTKYTKQKISAALREQVWIQSQGHVFKAKCAVTWCQNIITVFDFQCGHDIPESKGGPTDITNLYPICGKCNLSMGNHYTFKEWCVLYKGKSQEVPLAIPSLSLSLPPPFPLPLPPPLLKKPYRRSWIDFFFCRKKHKYPVSAGETDGVHSS